MTATNDPTFLTDHRTLTRGAALVDLGNRTLVELAGEDRAKFLHNLSTNDIRKLAPGAGCEAFLTNVQAKILAHVLVFAEPDVLVLETGAPGADAILAQLDRYLIREKVTLSDRGPHCREWLLAGERAPEVLASLCGPTVPTVLLASAAARIAGREVWLRRVEIAGPVGFLIEVERSAAEEIATALEKAGAQRVGHAAYEAAKLETGFPLYGIDISEANLPQEVARDSRAISFTKGCYLGQETVARIDALGHVNKTLVGVRFSGDQVPEPGLELTAAGAKVGHVTSAAFSPRLAAPLALAYVRRGSNQLGSRLESALGSAEVIALPLGNDDSGTSSR